MRDEDGQVISEVMGEGVLGEFPILVPGSLTDTLKVKRPPGCACLKWRNIYHRFYHPKKA